MRTGFPVGPRIGQQIGLGPSDVWYVVTPGMQFGDEPHEGHEEDEATEATPAL